MSFSTSMLTEKKVDPECKPIVVLLLIQLDLMLKNTHFKNVFWSGPGIEIMWLLKSGGLYINEMLFMLTHSAFFFLIVIFLALNFAHL